MSFIDPTVLEPLRGASLFYPSAGRDWNEALGLFIPTITDYWFVDVAYFTHGRRGDTRTPMLAAQEDLSFQGFELTGPPIAERETRQDPSTGRHYPFIEPCTRSEVYYHGSTQSRIVVHWRRGFGQRSIACVDDIGVFFHRGDSPGEGGSNVYWLSPRWIGQVTTRLRDGGLVVTDGSLTRERKFFNFQRRGLGSEAAFAEARPFSKWGRHWTCVGWASERGGPTLIWKASKEY